MISDKKLFLFDIDGTLAVGDTLFEGSRRLLEHIQEIGGKSYFITNNSTKSGADYVKRFREVFGLETTQDLFITSGYMTIRFLQKHFSGQKIFVLGTASFVAELVKNNLIVTEAPDTDISCVVVAYDSELNYQKLIDVCKVLSTMDVPYYATNPDLCCPIDFGFVPDCGAICNMIESSTGKRPVYLGKPSGDVVNLCISASGFTTAETLVVGDRLYTDILCGVNAGVDTCVLYTGEATKEDVARCDYKPTYEFENVLALLSAVQASGSN